MRLLLGLALYFLLCLHMAQAQTRSGHVAGRVMDRDNGQTLPGASVWVQPSLKGDVADGDGNYLIGPLPPGSYSVHVRFLGFSSASRALVEVHPGRTTSVDFTLSPTVYEAAELVVTADYFDREKSSAAAVMVFDAEAIRSGAGTAGDVQRLLAGMPSVARSDDMRNALAVRGGSPIENRFLVDGIPVANLNHFPTQGSTGGAIGLLNPELISSVTFRTGAFGAEHFDRLSSVAELSLREPSDAAGQVDFGLAGFGLTAEGVLGSVKLLGAVRRSWVDLLVKSFLNHQADAIPVYGDAVLRASFATGSHRFVVLEMLGVDRSGLDREDARDSNENTYGRADFVANTVGTRWQWLWGKRGFSETAVSHSFNGQDLEFNNTSDGSFFYEDHSSQTVSTLHHTTRVALSPRLGIKFGFDADRESILSSRSRSRVGLHGTAGIGNRIRLEPAVRIDRYAGHTVVQPRVSLSLNSPSARVWIAGGRYAQALPLTLINATPELAGARPVEARHLVLGASWTPLPSLMVMVEAYQKSYDQLPVEPNSRQFVLDALYDESLSIPIWQDLGTDNQSGRARSRGLEITVRKALADNIYGMLAAGVSRAEYRDGFGEWHPRRFDNRLIATADGGWRINDRHSVSMRWTYAGGQPYTPIDVLQSTAAGSQVRDLDRLMAERLAAYHALSVRYDLRVPVRKRFLVAYASIWNVYNRRNISGYYWDETSARERARLQWGLLPIIGLELEL